MGICEVCGNKYDKTFTVNIKNETHIFDSLECAIQAIAPSCSHCGCRVIGHGMEENDQIFCCHHCLEMGKHQHYSVDHPLPV